MDARGARRLIGGGMALATACASIATATAPRHRTPARASQQPALGSLGTFTPAAGDPRLASSLGRVGLGTASGFRFTPAGGARQVTVAVRARAVTTEQAQRNAMAGGTLIAAVNPYAYNLGVSVGWKRFAISSDYARVDLGGVPGSRESADVALSYSGRRWSTRLALAADRALGDVPRLFGSDRAVALDLGGSYSINNRLDVTGGVRYKVEDDRLRLLADERRDGQAVYVGTAFRF